MTTAQAEALPKWEPISRSPYRAERPRSEPTRAYNRRKAERSGRAARHAAARGAAR